MFKRASELYFRSKKNPVNSFYTSRITESTHTELIEQSEDEPIHISHHGAKKSIPELFTKLSLKRKTPTKKGMGVFCDTALYANFIRSSLQILEIEIKHFAHPATFTSTEYASYDEISAWIVFVSDEGDFHFIDRFVDRYVDKPTLFICPQTSIVKTSKKINQFVAETQLFNLNTGCRPPNKIQLE